MLRFLVYISLILAPLLVLFGIVLAIIVAIFGLSALRSDVFGLFAMAFAAFALTTSVTAGLWLARASKVPPHPEPPSA